MTDCIDKAKLDYDYGKKYPYIKKPDNFSHCKQVAWGDIVYTYFTTIKNIRVVPLAYIIRNTPAPSGIVIDREYEIIQNAPLQGNIFSRDTKKVLAIIKDLRDMDEG